MPRDVLVPLTAWSWGQFLAGGAGALGVEWGEDTLPEFWGVLGGPEALGMGLGIFLFSSLHLEAAIYFNFQNTYVTAWKTGKAKLAESSPHRI